VKLGGVWYREALTETAFFSYKIKKLIYVGETKYQKVEVVDTYDYGKCLILDGKLQSAVKDEWVYHEALVHPLMVTHPNPKNILVIGGGEGAVLREVLKHGSVVSVTMVDLDKEVIEISKKYLGEICKNSFNNKKVKLVFADGRKFLEKQPKESFDGIIVDVTDPLEEGPSALLYTKEFYRLIKSRLKKDGLMVTQATSIYHSLDCFSRIYKTISVVFPVARAFKADVPAYSSAWGFVLGSKKYDPLKLNQKDVDRILKERKIKNLKFYDGLTHQTMFILPKHLRKKLQKEKEIVKDSKPVFMAS
jgi:spermidine synthase